MRCKTRTANDPRFGDETQSVMGATAVKPCWAIRSLNWILDSGPAERAALRSSARSVMCAPRFSVDRHQAYQSVEPEALEGAGDLREALDDGRQLVGRQRHRHLHVHALGQVRRRA